VIDTHSHIYLSEFDQDLNVVLERAMAAGVSQVLMPNVDGETIERMHLVEDRYPDYCKSMMGIHPTSIKENYKKHLAIIEKWFHHRSYIAVGEIGMDLYWDKTFVKEQKEVFETQLIWAKEKNLPVVIHCREAFKETFEVLERQLDEKLYGVFHSFTGQAEDAARIMEFGNFHLGINGVVTFKNTTLREVLQNVPLEKIVLETDAPYLAPVPKRGKRNEPAYLCNIAQQIAGVYGLTQNEIDQITTNNARKLFKI